MKKTISITIGGLVFNIEEDGYTLLNNYLESLKGHFTQTSYGTEVVTDIESRIAEQFTNKTQGNSNRAVTKAELEQIVKSIGTVEDFKGSETETENTPKNSKKKFFRSSDDVIIAGVASGIAAYLDWDTTLVRVLFALIVLAGGWGIILYIILWLIMPQAHSASEKLEMRGMPVTIKEFEQTAKEKIAEVKASGFLERTFQGLGKLIQGLVRIIFVLAGLWLTLGATFAVFGLTFTGANLIFNRNSPYVNSPLTAALHGSEYFLAITLVFITILIPVIFLALAGITLVRRKSSFNKVVATSLFAIWMLAAAGTSVIAVKELPNIQTAFQTYQGQTETRTVPVSNFSKIDAGSDFDVNVKYAKTYSVSLEGHSRDLEQTEINSAEDTLAITRRDNFKLCLICWTDKVTVNVFTPNLEQIKGHDASNITVSGFKNKKMDIELSDASRGTIDLVTNDTTVNLHDASSARLTGKSQTLTSRVLDASQLSAFDFLADDVIIKVRDASRAEVWANKTLDATAQDGSQITYRGTPKIIRQNDSDGSSIKAE